MHLAIALLAFFEVAFTGPASPDPTPARSASEGISPSRTGAWSGHPPRNTEGVGQGTIPSLALRAGVRSRESGPVNAASKLATIGNDDDSKVIPALLQKQADDWNRADLDGFMETYWKSPKLVFQSGGTRSEGWETVRDRYRKRYQGEGKAMGKLEFRGIEAESLGPDSAFARGRWELTMPDGSKPGGLFTLILRRLPEGWRIVHDHTSIDTP